MSKTNLYMNPWLQEVLSLFKSHLSERALRERFWKARNENPGLTWLDFLHKSARPEKLEDPLLGIRIAETPLPRRIKSALHEAYKDWIGRLTIVPPKQNRERDGNRNED